MGGTLQKNHSMTFNGLQMAALVKLAEAITRADGKIKNEEVAVQALELSLFGISDDATKGILNTAKALDYGHAISIVSTMTLEQKKHVTGFLAAVMASDGDIADSELEVWRLISTLASLPTMTVREALSFWKDNK